MVELFIGEVRVGVVSGAFCSDATWHGKFDAVSRDCPPDLARRIESFIAFCEDWNERLAAGNAEPSEFEAYREIIESNQWAARRSSIVEDRIAGAPVFFRGGEVSWRVA